jgi:hypothetical protein
MIDVERDYMYESQDCTRYQYNRDCPALDDIANLNSHVNRHSRTYTASKGLCVPLEGAPTLLEGGACVRHYNIDCISHQTRKYQVHNALLLQDFLVPIQEVKLI